MISCAATAYDNAEWPVFAPLGEDTYVNSTACKNGYRAINPDQPTQRICKASGVWDLAVVNPCVRTCCAPCAVSMRLPLAG